MISRERWLSLLLGEKPDRIPTDYWATPEVTDRLLRELRCSDLEQLYQALHIDAVVQVEPPHKTNHYPNDRLADIWGLRRKRVSYGT
ncbi:MAG: uroporphyrinogen-III decarboxylase-like protein, partial [Acidobacteriota bacterium]